MAKEYKVGEKYYLPVTVFIDRGEGDDFPIGIEFFDGKQGVRDSLRNKPDLLLTAEEIISNILLDNNNYMTLPSRTLVVSEEETRIKTLTDKIATLTDERDGARKQADIFQEEIKKLTAERDKFAKTAKDKADLANKACTERDAAQGDLVTAREAIDYLQEENKKLKQELKDAEACYDVVADTSIKRKNRVTTMEEVIVALVEKIRGLEGGET